MAGEEFCMILVTVPDEELGDKLSTGLVEAKLAACVTRLGKGVSTYVWEGKMEKDEEYLLIIKTRAGLFPSVRRYILENHSAKVPEIIAFPIFEGHPAYLQWVGANTQFAAPRTKPHLPF